MPFGSKNNAITVVKARFHRYNLCYAVVEHAESLIRIILDLGYFSKTNIFYRIDLKTPEYNLYGKKNVLKQLC